MKEREIYDEKNRLPRAVLTNSRADTNFCGSYKAKRHRLSTMALVER